MHERSPVGDSITPGHNIPQRWRQPRQL